MHKIVALIYQKLKRQNDSKKGISKKQKAENGHKSVKINSIHFNFKWVKIS